MNRPGEKPFEKNGKIEAVVFDLGNVLVDFDFSPFFQFLKDHDITATTEAEFHQACGTEGLKTGALGASEFLENISRILKRPVATSEIKEKFQNIFTPAQPMLEFVSEIRKSRPVYVLSDTNELHWDFICNRFHVHNYIDGFLGSHQAGALKPSLEIYTKAEHHFQISPGTTIFIDDLVENVEGARRAGWIAFQHLSAVETISTLRSLLKDAW